MKCETPRVTVHISHADGNSLTTVLSMPIFPIAAERAPIRNADFLTAGCTAPPKITSL
jgi:hypothetical protein